MPDKRTRALCRYIDAGRGLIDVGTDHGYLPIWMAQQGYEGEIFASDLRPGPLDTARRNAQRAGLEDRIHFLLCDGLDLCPPEKIDTVTIAGMGGDTICHILDRAEWIMDRRYKLILQPMSKSQVLRYWLTNNEFQILQEELVEDGDTMYQILVARFGGSQRLSDAQLYLGAKALHRDLELYQRQRQRLRGGFLRALEGMEQGTAPNKGLIRLYRDILRGLEEGESHD